MLLLPATVSALAAAGSGSVPNYRQCKLSFLQQIIKNENHIGQMRGSNALDAALLLEAHNVLVRCLVPRDQLLEFDVFEEDDDAVKAKIKAFLGY